MNYSIKLDLAKLNRVGVAKITGKSGETLNCVVIPVNENNIFISEKGGIYLDMAAFEMKSESYGQTHLIKPSLTEEQRKQMTKDEKNALPIIGALKPMKAKQAEVTTELKPTEYDDLPF